jgi:hypothetical protein
MWIFICLILGGAAFVGYAIQPYYYNIQSVDLEHIRIIDAVLGLALGIFVWGLFCLVGFQRFSGTRLAVSLFTASIVWALLLGSLMYFLAKFENQGDQLWRELYESL